MVMGRRKASAPFTEAAKREAASPGPGPKATLCEVKVADLAPSPQNRAVDVKGAGFRELAESVAQAGVKVPLLVRPRPNEDGNGKLEICDGERRWRAAIAAGQETVPAVVRDISPGQARALTAVANLHREALPPLDEGRMVAELLEAYSGDAKAVAAEVGHSETWIRQRARLMKLTDAWRKTIGEAQLRFADWGAAHLVLIARLPAETQDYLLKTPFEYHPPRTVSELAKALAEYERTLRKAPWKLDDAKLFRKAGACVSCTKRSTAQGLLFHERLDPEQVKKQDRCLDPRCWDRKLKAHLKAKVTRALDKHPDAPKVAEGYAGPRDAFKSWEYKAAKKGEKDAVQAVVVHGPGAGKTTWVKLGRKSPSAMEGRAADPRDKKLTPKQKAKALRELLAREREAAYYEQLGQAVASGKLKRPADIIEVLRLAAAFGTISDVWGPKAVERYKDRGDAGMPVLLLDIWEGVRRMAQEDNDIAGLELVVVAGGADLDAIRKEVEAAVPEPKELAELEAQGTKGKKAKD